MKRCIVAGCVVIKDGRVLMLWHNKIRAWLMPGGHVEAGEFPDEAAIRETKEETGLDVEIVGDREVEYGDEVAHSLAKPFVIMYENVPYKTEPMHVHFDLVYVARVKSGGLKESGESSGIGWYGKDEIMKIDTLENVRNVALAALDKYGSML